MTRVLVDAQLPPALARSLSELGMTAHHVSDIGWERASDVEIWRQSQGHYDWIISKDVDFVTLALLRTPGPCVIWVRKSNCSRRELIGWFKPLLPQLVARYREGEQIIEISG